MELKTIGGPESIRRDRLKAALTESGLDQSELARRVGCTPGAINQMLSGHTRTSRFLPDIARELGVAVDWLMGRTGDAERQRTLYSHELLEQQLDAVMVNQVEMGLSMGGGSTIEDWPVVQQVPISRSWLRSLTPNGPENVIIAPGIGDSMWPTISDRDLAFIDRAQNTPRLADQIYALTYGGWGMIKRLRALPDGSLQINSDNPQVSPITAYDGEAQIIGRVVGLVRRI